MPEAETDAVETLSERDARLHAWLAGVGPGDTVTVRLNSTDTLTGKVYEAPDAGGTSLCVNTTILRYGNRYPGASFEPEPTDPLRAIEPALRAMPDVFAIAIVRWLSPYFDPSNWPGQESP